MKITLVLPELNLAGGTKIALEYAHYLQVRGNEVTCIFPRPRLRTLREVARDFIRGRTPGKAPPPNAAHTWGKDLKIIQARRRGSLSEADLPDADVVIGTWWETLEWIDKLSARKGAKVHFVQGHEVLPGLPIDRVEATYRNPCHKIVVSEWLREVMGDLYQARSVTVVPNGIDLARFKPMDSERNVMEIGLVWSDAECKNSMMGIDAAEIARARLPELHLTVFGAGPCPDVCRDRDWITYRASPAQDEIPSIYARCRLWLFTSIAEGFGLPILEALASGTPVVATRAGAAPQLIDGTNGRLIDCDADQMAAAIVSMFGHTEAEWAAFAASARQTALEFDWEKSAQKFEAALKSMVGH